MRKQSRFAATGITALVVMILLTGCTTEKQEEQKETARKYQQKAEYYAEGNNYEEAQKAIDRALEQNPEDEALQEASEKLKQEAEEMKAYNETMSAAMEAIGKDDAEGLNKLQESKEGKALIRMAKEKGNYIYMPEGGTSGTGIGLYVFKNCSCKQWYYGEYQDGKREGDGKWYYVSTQTEDGSLYREVYNGQWSKDVPNGTGHQFITMGDQVDTDQKFKVKNGLFYGKYKIKDKLEDGTVVTGKYKLKNGKYVTISDKELEENHFAVPEEPHLAIAFLYDEAGEAKSCTMIYAEDVTRGVKHFY